MNVQYTNKHFRSFLRRNIKRPNEFANKYHYNTRNMRRWLYNDHLFPRPPMIALLCKQISECYGVPLEKLILDCFAALQRDMDDHFKMEYSL